MIRDRGPGTARGPGPFGLGNSGAPGLGRSVRHHCLDEARHDAAQPPVQPAPDAAPAPPVPEQVAATIAQYQAQAGEQYAAAEREYLDQILAKVKSDGLGALTDAERKFLERVSKQGQK